MSMKYWRFLGGMGTLDFCLLKRFDKVKESLVDCYKEQTERNHHNDITTIFCGAIHNFHHYQLVSVRFEQSTRQQEGTVKYESACQYT
ncbi:MAG: hypothetical protein JRE64_12795 [Deltaproteobacteria bacterium]|nr:hypothetical protein [Deltaproteobacteria bacterium]